MKQVRPYPHVIVTRKAARSLAGGHPWVFEGEVLRLEPSPADGRVAENGDVVDVFEENGTWQGAGLLSEQSKIRVRIVTRNANDRVDEAFWRRRAQWAWAHRRTAMGGRSLPGAEPDTNACRVVFSEADGFPGLVVDRYENVLVAQVGTFGMDRLRPTVYAAVLDALHADGQDVTALYERNDTPSRAKEGLPLEKGWWDGPGVSVPESPRVMVCENGLRFDLDIENSQKTGFFLDQKYNRRAVRELSAGRRVLDCFCHVGPFGLNAAAGGAELVRCVDVSQTAIDLARENARLNGLDARMDFTCANVLDYLPELAHDRRRLREEGGPFDLIVLDPPAFTKSRGTVSHAARGYREINYEALRLLPRGGYLATCSCSQHMTRDLLAKAIAEAAHQANVQLKQVEERQQAPDHPILWGFSESHYLDFFIFQVV
ncbi:class I SAM-dependent rRNA methyltransferase [Olsenella profusa]|uniref:Class I SAM-dependent rRNA methyltransferase n=1 Tax=Olsenella profusa TaxID=138595 RepID=A0ABS2F1P1_9ACTN|nr:class I SAM-dependent rRNA methyltransferase [Olsenella profusa]MBM6774518.1 class I SAM-dependent rRNA methyltransferase [Olsenella profusa]